MHKIILSLKYLLLNKFTYFRNFSFISGILTLLNKNISDQNEYLDNKDEVEKWLESANKIIQKCENIKHLDHINTNLAEITVSTLYPYCFSRKHLLQFFPDFIEPHPRSQETY